MQANGIMIIHEVILLYNIYKQRQNINYGKRNLKPKQHKAMEWEGGP